MKIELDIPDALLIDMIDRGQCAWINDIVTAPRGESPGATALRGGKVVITHDNTKAGRKRNMRTPLNRECIERGVLAFATQLPHHFGDMLAKRGDAATGDYFLQCCLFGEVMFE